MNALRGLFFVVQIAPRHQMAFDHELAHRAHRHQKIRVARINHPDPSPDSSANVRAVSVAHTVCLVDFCARGGYDGAFCRSIRIDERAPCAPLLKMTGRHSLSARDERLEARTRSGLSVLATDGVRRVQVTLLSRIAAARSFILSPSDGTQTHPPTRRQERVSIMLASKVYEAN